MYVRDEAIINLLVGNKFRQLAVFLPRQQLVKRPSFLLPLLLLMAFFRPPTEGVGAITVQLSRIGSTLILSTMLRGLHEEEGTWIRRLANSLDGENAGSQPKSTTFQRTATCFHCFMST